MHAFLICRRLWLSVFQDHRQSVLQFHGNWNYRQLAISRFSRSKYHRQQVVNSEEHSLEAPSQRLKLRSEADRPAANSLSPMANIELPAILSAPLEQAACRWFFAQTCRAKPCCLQFRLARVNAFDFRWFETAEESGCMYIKNACISKPPTNLLES